MITPKGQSIEDKSMEIIESEIGSHPYSQDEWTIVKRVIHSTADFDFARANKIVFHNQRTERACLPGTGSATKPYAAQLDAPTDLLRECYAFAHQYGDDHAYERHQIHV